MRKLHLTYGSLLAASLLSLQVGAGSTAGPTATLTAWTGDGEQQTYQFRLVEGKKGWEIPSQVIETSEFTVGVSGGLNPDPAIAYGFAVTDFGAPTAFAFLFFTPIVPTGPSTVVSASIVGGLTDFTGDGVSITPLLAATLQTSDVTAPVTSMGVPVGPSLAAGPSAPGSFYGYGPSAAGPIAGPVGIWTGLSVSTSFTLSGGSDIAVLTGFASVDTAPPVPDGGAGLAGLAALAGIAMAGRVARRR